MALAYRYLRFRLRLSDAGLWPTSKVGLIAWFLLGMDALLFVLQKVFGWIKPSYGQEFSGWIGFLTFVAIVLFGFMAFRWLKAKALWRLRNRLIITYVFIGFVPLVLLVALAL
jgi:sigma-B regulation protein RsbU (phosphoserine phosphatase)